MSQVKINGKTYEFKEGCTILECASENGISIPTMCYLKETGALTSCFICAVEVEGKANLLPACATKAKEGMVIITDSIRVREARKKALELLLSDHTGDCLGPCHMGCPAHINIPKFIGELCRGDNKAAIITIKKSVALPAVLGRICPEICEKVCRRNDKDSPVAICHLKRYAADFDLLSPDPYLPSVAKSTGKRVAVIGGGAAGLTAAYYLKQFGHEVTVFEKNEKLGGGLRSGVKKERLPEEVLDKEIGQILKLGVAVKLKTELGRDIGLKEVRESFDAVFLAAGWNSEVLEVFRKEGLAVDSSGVRVSGPAYETNIKGVFAGEKTKLAVRASAIGRFVAVTIDKYLKGLPLEPEKKPFSVKMGKVSQEELEILTQGASESERFLKDQVDTTISKENSGEERIPFLTGEVFEESKRCLRCACRKEETCLLKKYSIEYDADIGAFKGQKRGFTRDIKKTGVVYESGKCIMCGICVEISKKNKEISGFTYINRGFNAKIDVPFNKKINKVMQKTAEECAEKCPTGAISKSL
ncbi:MAG: FAD-dependent oxidoreductase [Candidatus Firestonebacteria bacterium]